MYLKDLKKITLIKLNFLMKKSLLILSLGLVMLGCGGVNKYTFRQAEFDNSK